MTKWLLAAALMPSAFASSATAQTKESLVGTWKLVSYKVANEKGEVTDPFGPNPVGFLTLTSDGRVSVIMADPRRNGLAPSSASDAANAIPTFFAYAGTYRFERGQIAVHVEVASYQPLVNTDQARSVKIEGDRLTLQGRWLVNGVTYNANSQLIWERVKPQTAGK